MTQAGARRSKEGVRRHVGVEHDVKGERGGGEVGGGDAKALES